MAQALDYIQRGILRVDDDGSIWRIGYVSHGAVKPCAPRRAEAPNRNGYLRVVLSQPGSSRTHSVMAHGLVWTHFHGAIAEGLQVNHKDLIRDNNHPGNLELLTAAGNIQHSYANGRTKPWAKRDPRTSLWRGKPMITDEKKEAMRRGRAAGWLLIDIAAEFGVSLTETQRICSKKKEAQV